MLTTPARRRSAPAVAVVFFANGAVFASWIPRIPEVQADLGLSASALGLVLAGGGAGGLLGTVLSPLLVRRVGSRPAAVLAGAALALSLPLVATAPAAWALAAVLLVAAAFDAVTDIAMNDLGVALQRAGGRSLMNRLHAGWSMGALSGAAVSSAVAAGGVTIEAHFAAVGVVLAAVLALTGPHLPAVRAAPRATAPRRRALGPAGVLVPLAFGAAVVEGVPAEWSGVFLAEVHGLGPGAVGLGFALFSGAMLAGRLVGDTVVDRVGPGAVSRGATVATAAGVLVVVLAPGPEVAVAGFGLAGLGVSVLFPLIYGAAGSLAAVSSGSGLALMSVGARAGFLAGPVLVGVTADLAGLRVAVGALVLAALAGVVATRSRLARYAA